MVANYKVKYKGISHGKVWPCDTGTYQMLVTCDLIRICFVICRADFKKAMDVLSKAAKESKCSKEVTGNVISLKSVTHTAMVPQWF